MQTVPKLGTGELDRAKETQLGAGSPIQVGGADPKAARAGVNADQLKVLTGLTFIPLFAITYHHAHDFWMPMQGLLEKEVAFKHFVSMFFVLSGFVIAFRHNQLKGAASTLRFYVDSAASLWPMHLLCLFSLLFLVPEVFSIKGDQLPPFLCNLFMAQTWIPIAKYYFSFNSPSWTTTTMFALCAAFPLLLLAARRSKVLVLSVTAALAFALICATNALHLPVDDLTGASIQGMVYINPLARMLEFTAGVVAALTYLRYADKVKLSPLVATALEFAAIALIAFVNVHSRGWQLQATPYITEAGAFWLHHSAVPFIPFALFITILLTHKGLVSKFFGSKPMVFLGELSLSMFMIHGVLIAFVNVNFRQEQSMTSAFYALSGLLIASHIMQNYIVRPLRELIIKQADKLISPRFPAIQPSSNPSKSARFDNKNRWLLAAEVVACAVMFYLAQPTIVPITAEQSATIGATATVKDVQFEPWLTCVNGSAHQEKERVTINTIWQPLKSETVDFFIIARVLDKSNNVLGVKRYTMDGRHQQVSPTQLWSDTVDIDVPAGAQATRVAIKITKGKRKAVAATSNQPTQIEQSEMLVPLASNEVSVQ